MADGARDPDATKERYEGDTQERFWDNASQVLFANIKRTYDEYQGVSLDQQRALNQLSVQALQNSVETANMVSKQAVRHSDLAIDRQWNLDEVAALAAGAHPTIVALAAAMAVAVAAEMNKDKA
jgi:hypothetical protein